MGAHGAVESGRTVVRVQGEGKAGGVLVVGARREVWVE